MKKYLSMIITSLCTIISASVFAYDEWPEDFNHKAFYNNEHHRIEMHLEANKDVRIELSDENRTIEIKKSVMGKEHSSVAKGLLSLGEYYFKNEKYEDAISIFLNALNILESNI